ncbi:MAG: glycosyltransferase family 9 protein [Pseudonocardiales bacterium]
MAIPSATPAGQPRREVLVLRALGLGDLLCGLPAYRGLRHYFAGHRMILAAPRELADLALHTGAFDEVLATPGLTALNWQRPPPDVAVNLHGKGPRSHELLLAVAPRRRIGFRGPGWAGPVWWDEEHEVHRWCRMLHSAGITANPDHLRLFIPAVPSVAPDAVVIHPGAGHASRCWPADRYAEVARRLSAGRRVVVTGTAAEIALAEQVSHAAGLPARAVLAGQLDLVQFAALIASARLVVCGDTGAGHLATAFGTPSVLLFGPVSPRLWGPPPGSRQHVVIWHGPHRGDPWGIRPDPALLSITPKEVLAAANRLLLTARSFPSTG